SFVKESLRLYNDIVALPHKCISKPHYTFENGYQIPNGRIVILNLVDTINDEDLQGRNPKEFYAYRHLERNTQATKIERNFLNFEGGKNSCPGRYLAVNQIKLILHQILLKYNIRTESEKALPKVYNGTRVVHLKDGVIFEKRKDVIN
ncbi:4894_t:CDS:2, partial [Scutellospora calospora]